MKKLTAIIGICMIACMAQAETAGTLNPRHTGSSANFSQSGKSDRQFDPQKILARIDEALAKRNEQMDKANENGRTDIAAAIQKVISDLNSMKTALNSKDKEAFKSANEQRKQDREALQALIKTAIKERKQDKNSGSNDSEQDLRMD